LTGGNPYCWGDNFRDQLVFPRDVELTVFALGGDFSCAITSDTTLVCWGGDYRDSLAPPLGSGFVALTAGGPVCGLKQDGSIECTSDRPTGE
jgi:hypothetical protein